MSFMKVRYNSDFTISLYHILSNFDDVFFNETQGSTYICANSKISNFDKKRKVLPLFCLKRQHKNRML